jgi:DNA-binding NtrC family response regulator
LADGGTLFLDEVGEIPLELQGKLLRVLQEGHFERVGEERTRTVDVRVIAATNRDLRQMVAEGKFQEDLYYRLNVIPVHIPPLRERREDIPAMIEQFGGEFARRYGKPSRMADAAAMDALTRHDWPGNVRALRHAVERATILASGHGFSLSDFALVSGHASSPQPGDQYRGASQPPQTLEEIERAAIASALIRHGGNASHAAAELGITRQSLYRRMEKHGL